MKQKERNNTGKLKRGFRMSIRRIRDSQLMDRICSELNNQE